MNLFNIFRSGSLQEISIGNVVCYYSHAQIIAVLIHEARGADFELYLLDQAISTTKKHKNIVKGMYRGAEVREVSHEVLSAVVGGITCFVDPGHIRRRLSELGQYSSSDNSEGAISA